jgi:hypothetical protein
MRTPGSGHSGDSAVVPGHRDKHAHVERGRRVLVAGLPPGGAGAAAGRPGTVRGLITNFCLSPAGLEPGGDEAG